MNAIKKGVGRGTLIIRMRRTKHDVILCCVQTQPDMKSATETTVKQQKLKGQTCNFAQILGNTGQCRTINTKPPV